MFIWIDTFYNFNLVNEVYLHLTHFFTVSTNYNMCDGPALPAGSLEASSLAWCMAIRQRLQRNLFLSNLFRCHGPWESSEWHFQQTILGPSRAISTRGVEMRMPLATPLVKAWNFLVAKTTSLYVTWAGAGKTVSPGERVLPHFSHTMAKTCGFSLKNKTLKRNIHFLNLLPYLL